MKAQSKKSGSTQCKLCLQDKNLCESHIVPEFLYRPLYDEKHTCLFINTELDLKDRVIRKGLREELLCAACEGLLNPNETYCRNLLFGNGRGDLHHVGHEFKNIDYKRLKLFQLSVLWRASISKHFFFEQVNVGDVHEEKLRRMILEGNPGKEMDYPCVMTMLLHEGQPIPDFIFQPRKGRYLDHHCYLFIFGSFEWRYFVSSHRLPDDIYQLALKDDGTLPLAVEELENQLYFQEVCEGLQKSGKLLRRS